MEKASELPKEAVVGVFDSGLGGLTVLREMERRFPHRRFIYLGDNARYPYGTKGDATIKRYGLECAHFLLSHEVELIVVACNTVSSVALTELTSDLPVPVIGTIEPAVRSALGHLGVKRVGVIGTNATIASKAYQAAISKLQPNIEVKAVACPLFVPLVESGMFSGEIVDKVVEHYLKPLKEAHVDALILGCTHYPLLAESIRQYLGEGVHVVECSSAVADAAEVYLGNGGIYSDPDRLRFFTTDEVGNFNQLATQLLGTSKVEAVRLEGL